MRGRVRGGAACAVVVAVVFLLRAGPVSAETIDFTEVPAGTRADGAKIEGVTFNFTVNGVASTMATIGTTGPGTTTITQAPMLEGPTTGLLTLNFPTPVSQVGFSYVALYQQADPNGLTVTMLDSKGGTVSKDLAIERIAAYSGVRYDNTPVVPIVRLTIDPNQLRGARFAVDNVTFTPVPEPAGLLPLAASAATLLARRRRR